jgi:hypothetical protein
MASSLQLGGRAILVVECCCGIATAFWIHSGINFRFSFDHCRAAQLPRQYLRTTGARSGIFGGERMFLEIVKLIRGRDAQRRLILAAVLLSGGAPFTGCFGPFDLGCTGSDCPDPPVAGLHDPYLHAGATVSVRTPAAGGNGVTLFARTGVLAPIDGSSSAVTPSIAGITPNGTASQRENIAVPLYGGVTVPAKNVGVPIPNLAFEAFGGANIKKEKSALSVNETTGAIASGSQSYWTANPAVGAGIQYYLGTFYGVPTSLGAAYIVDYQPGTHTLNVASPDVVGQSYQLTNPSHLSQTAAFTLNFDLPPK